MLKSELLCSPLNITIILANVSNFGLITHAGKLQVLDVVVLYLDEILYLINHLYSQQNSLSVVPSVHVPADIPKQNHNVRPKTFKIKFYIYI